MRSSTSTTSFLSRLPFYVLPLLSTVYGDAVTVYTKGGSATTTSLAAGATYSGLAAYDPTTLTPPAPPSPAVTAIGVSLQQSPASAMAAGLMVSIPQKGNFLGFSIELSVANVVLGENGNQLKTQFLNYMANIQNRAGAGPLIRVGGNTQETSTIFASGFNGSLAGPSIEKIYMSNAVVSVIPLTRAR